VHCWVIHHGRQRSAACVSDKSRVGPQFCSGGKLEHSFTGSVGMGQTKWSNHFAMLRNRKLVASSNGGIPVTTKNNLSVGRHFVQSLLNVLAEVAEQVGIVVLKLFSVDAAVIRGAHVPNEESLGWLQTGAQSSPCRPGWMPGGAQKVLSSSAGLLSPEASSMIFRGKMLHCLQTGLGVTRESSRFSSHSAVKETRTFAPERTNSCSNSLRLQEATSTYVSTLD